MRILLDECVHAGVRAAFPGHAVSTVTEAGWRGSKDQSLLKLAERGFDVFVTIDRKFERQFDPQEFALGFVIVRVTSNTLAAYVPSFERLRESVERVCKGEVIHLDARGPVGIDSRDAAVGRGGWWERHAFIRFDPLHHQEPR